MACLGPWHGLLVDSVSRLDPRTDGPKSPSERKKIQRIKTRSVDQRVKEIKGPKVPRAKVDSFPLAKPWQSFSEGPRTGAEWQRHNRSFSLSLEWLPSRVQEAWFEIGYSGEGGTKRSKLELGWAMSPAYAASFLRSGWRLCSLTQLPLEKRPTSKSSTPGAYFTD